MAMLNRFVPRYSHVMREYLLAPDEMAREMCLSDATEVGKDLVGDGPTADHVFELHRRVQRTVAREWALPDASSEQRQARERLVEGEALPLMVALLLPHEVAQRAHHERRWRRDNAKLSAMFEQTDNLMVIFDADGLIDDVNAAFVQVTGWSALEAAMGTVETWRTPLPLDGTQHCHGEQVRSDGTRYVAEWSVSPIFGQDGKLINHVCIGRDVTRQQQIDDSLRENDKLRAVATLAAGIAHDFNNLLGSIIGLAEVCLVQAPEGSRMARNLGRIHEAGDKAAALVRQMLDFSRQTPTTTQRVALGSFIARTQSLLRAGLPLNVALDVRVDMDSEVCIDLVQMEQVLLNMSGNAGHALRGRDGHLSIVLDRADPQARAATAPDAPCTHARIRVADDGVGMPADVMQKIFEPFFTTKPVGEGTGLGLAAAHGIVSSHGGCIEVASTEGVGTTFSIFLPLMSAPAADSVGADDAPAQPQVPALPVDSASG